MARYDHWRCVLFLAEQEEILDFLSFASENGESVIGTSRCFALNIEDDWLKMGFDPDGFPRASVCDLGAYSALALLIYLGTPDNGYWMIWTGYPYLNQGEQCEITIDKISSSEYGMEAIISAKTNSGFSVDFLDTYYFKNAGTYKKGDRILVEMGAMAFSLRRIKELLFFQYEPDDKGAPNFDLSDDKKNTYRATTALMKPVEGAFSFEYWFSGPVKSIETLWGHGQKYYRITLTVLLSCADSSEFDVPVLVSEQILRGPVPVVGDVIEGCLWLHGRYVDPQET